MRGRLAATRPNTANFVVKDFLCSTSAHLQLATDLRLTDEKLARRIHVDVELLFWISCCRSSPDGASPSTSSAEEGWRFGNPLRSEAGIYR